MFSSKHLTVKTWFRKCNKNKLHFKIVCDTRWAPPALQVDVAMIFFLLRLWAKQLILRPWMLFRTSCLLTFCLLHLVTHGQHNVLLQAANIHITALKADSFVFSIRANWRRDHSHESPSAANRKRPWTLKLFKCGELGFKFPVALTELTLSLSFYWNSKGFHCQ